MNRFRLLAPLARYRRFWVMYLVVLVLDRITKLLVLHGTAPTPRGSLGHPVIPGFFWLSHVYNPGAAWSMLSGRQDLLVLLAIGAMAAMYRWRRQLGLDLPFVQWVLGAFAGGAIGNVIDRLVYDHVVDFLLFRIPVVNYLWPSFNVADVGITVGAALYCWHGFRHPDPVKPDAPAGGAA